MNRKSQPYVEIGVRLRHAREARNLTIEQLSQRIGITKATLRNYERGTQMPDPAGQDSDGSKLCNTLDLEFNWLYRGDERWRKGTLSEKVALWRKVEPMLKEAARQRQLAGHAAESEKGRVREHMQRVTGSSEKTIERALAIVKAAEADPAKYGHLVEEMDRNGAQGTYKKLREMQAAKRR